MTEIVIIVMKYIRPQSNAHRGSSNDSYQRGSATPWMIERGKNCSLDFYSNATHRDAPRKTRRRRAEREGVSNHAEITTRGLRRGVARIFHSDDDDDDDDDDDPR